MLLSADTDMSYAATRVLYCERLTWDSFHGGTPISQHLVLHDHGRNKMSVRNEPHEGVQNHNTDRHRQLDTGTDRNTHRNRENDRDKREKTK